MNVRFFAGTRAQYDALVTPRNPQALYFCSDTNELFWGDRLLTDGMRVVPTYKDLPSPEKAADGVVYYVTETRNGYVVPHGGSEWLQTIYAPLRKGETAVPGEEDNTVTTVGAVNDIVEQIYIDIDERFENFDGGVDSISFAGVKLEEVDGVFAIDRACARRALGFNVPVGQEEADIEIATKEYVDNQIAAIPEPDLSDYAKIDDIPDVSKFITSIPDEYITETELEAKGYITNVDNKADIDHKHDDLYDIKGAAQAVKDDLLSGAGDAYDTLKELGDLIKNNADTIEALKQIATDKADKGHIHENYAEKDHEHKQYLTEHQDLSEYAKRDELFSKSYNDLTDIPKIPSIEGLATEEYVDTKFDSIEIPEVDLSDYYTIEETNEAIAEAVAAVEHPIVNLDNYVTKDEIEGLIREIPSEYITEEELEAKGYITNVDDKADINHVHENYADKEHGHEEYLTAADITGKADAVHSHDEIYAIKEHVHEQYLTEHQSLEDYAKKSDIPNIEGLATESFVLDELKKVEIPEIPTNISAFTNDAGYLTEHQDLSEYTKSAIVAKQRYEVLPVDGLLISYRGDEVRLNTQRVVPVHQNVGEGGNPNTFNVTFRAYAPEEATKVIKGVIDGNTGAIEKDTEAVELHTDAYGRKYRDMWAATAMYTGASWLDYGSLSTVEKYLGHRYVFEWYNEDKLIGSDRFNIVLTNDSCHNDAVPAEVIKRINDKVNAIKIPEVDFAGYATETFVNDAIAAIEHPVTDLKNYVTKDEIKDFIVEIPSEYVTESELDAKGYITDISGKADVNHVHENYANKEHTHEEYLTAEDIAGKADIDHNHDDLYEVKGTAQAIKEELLNGAGSAFDTLKELGDLIEANSSTIEALEQIATGKANVDHIHGNYADKVHKHSEYLTVEDISDKADVVHTHTLSEITDYVAPEIPSVEGLASEAFVLEQIEAIQFPETDLSNYYTKTETTDAINEAINGIEFPETDLSDYYNKVETSDIIAEAIAEKADEVPFVVDSYVSNPIGEFKVGDNLKDFTIAQIFAKLLGLSNTPVQNPDEPGVPDEPVGLIETLIANKVVMYSITNDSELKEIPFKLVDYTATPTESGFYITRDEDGNVVDAGYQDLTIVNDEMYYIIALPKEVNYNTNVLLYSWDDDEKIWVEAVEHLVSDPDEVAILCDEAGVDISHIDTTKYTIWVLEDTCTGKILRYSIKEAN